jgi:hypothetical protein
MHIMYLHLCIYIYALASREKAFLNTVRLSAFLRTFEYMTIDSSQLTGTASSKRHLVGAQKQRKARYIP